MGFRTSLLKQQGQYRYDPTHLDQGEPARLFPFAGNDGILRYVLKQSRQRLTEQGQLSQPWTLLLKQLDTGIRSLDQTWIKLGTLLVDWKIFQSGWFNFNLPPDEQFDVSFVLHRRDLATLLLAARKAAQTAILTTDPALDQRHQQRSQFYKTVQARGRSRPVVVQIHERDGGLSDREFARQRLAGQNPMVIRQVRSHDQPVLQSWAPRWETTAADRLFLSEYPVLQSLTPVDLQPGRYVGSPIALFESGDQGLEPKLIQLEAGTIITPDAGDDWMRAKLFVQTADVTHHELITHLCDTHLAMEAFAIATPRQLPANHPLYRLLKPHFQFLLAVNTRGNTILLGPGAAIDHLLAPTREASLSLINQSYRSRRFQDLALPANLQDRGLEALPDFPYRDDALLLWQAIARYVTRFLQPYYRDDRAVQQDPYLQAWAAELGTPLQECPRSQFAQPPTWMPETWVAELGLHPIELPAHARVSGFPMIEHSGQPVGGLTQVQQILDIATQVIFTCSAQHAAVNFSQFDYVGYTPNAPLSLAARPDRPVSLETLLPPLDRDLGQMELTLTLSGIRYGQLGSSELMPFVDTGDRQTLAEFQAELATIEDTIARRNQQRQSESGVEYPYLLPSRIPNSINI